MLRPSAEFSIAIQAGDASLEGMLEVPLEAQGVVLFAHGSGSSRFSPRNSFVAAVLRKRKLATLLIDLLTRAEDREYAYRFNIELLTERLGAVAEWIREESGVRELPLGLFGASTGAASALRLAAQSGRRIYALVSRGGRPDLAMESLPRVAAPTLLIVGGNDDPVIELNRRAYDEIRSEKELVIIPGATHLFEEPGTLEAVADRAAYWFTRHLPAAQEKSAAAAARPGRG
jgi:putative phosphoribosyl transferase